MTTIGIPRALMYYDYLPLWIKFFENLGATTILSDKTNKDILNDGVRYGVDECCLPVKLFYGHVANLKGKCDIIFLPRLMSIKVGEHICPQFGGLPELINSAIKDLPPMITTEINYNKNNALDAACEMGQTLTNNKKAIKKALDLAQLDFEKNLSNNRKSANYINQIKSKKIDISNNLLILGHAYNLYDEFINMNLLKKLEKMKVKCIIPDTVDEKYIMKYTKGDTIFWTQFRTLSGSAKYLIDQGVVQGIIYISSFGCGLDSVITNIVERVAKENNIPFMLLTIDEHTADAGVNTRIEAFVDMMNWRRFDEGVLSPHGECIYSL